MREKFIGLATMLLFSEFVRGAFIIGYLPAFATSQLQTSIAFVGIAVSIHFIFDTISNLFAGFLMERFGVKLTIRLSFLLSLVGLIIMNLFPSLLSVLVGASFLGVGLCPLWILILSKAHGSNRGRKMGIIYLAWLVGLSLGAMLINVVIQYQNELSFWMLFVAMTFSWIVFEYADRSTMFKTYNRSIKREWLSAMVILKKSKVVFPGILLQGIAIGMLIPILPSFVLDNLHISPSIYSLILLTGGLTTVFGLIPMGKISDRIGRMGPIICGFASLAFGIYLITIADTFLVIFLAAGVIGLSYAVLMPAWNSFMASFVPIQNQKSGWGIFASFQGLGGIVGPLLGGIVAAHLTISIAMYMSAGLMVTAALFYGGYYLRKTYS